MAAARGKIDLKADWERAVARYMEVTGQNLRRTPVPTPEQIIAQLSTAKIKDAKDHQKMDRVRDIAGKTLECVMRLGNIAAQAASMVFGPSSICMNAVSFFVGACKDYKNIFSGLDNLFSRIFDALERIELYMKNEELVPDEMAKMAHEVLMKFLSICELSNNVLHKSNKLFMALKTAAFSYDAGVNAELEALERLEVKEARMGIASNVITSRAIKKDVAKQSEDMRDMKDTLQQQKAESDADKQLNFIRDQLGNPKETSREDLKTYTQSFTASTAAWINDDFETQNWIDAQNKDFSTMFLVAEPGYGKTFVFSRIIQNLRKRYPQNLETTQRISVAWLYLDRETKRSVVDSNKTAAQASSSVNEKVSMDLILRTLALQIARNDPFYRKDLETSYQQTPDNSDDVSSLTRRLFLDHARSSATFFLLVDAINVIDDEQVSTLREVLGTLLSLNGGLQIKLLLTGTPTFMQDLTTRLTPSPINIQIAEKTNDDMEMFVSTRLDKMDIFKSSEAQSLKDEIRTGLVQLVGGDFVYCRLLLGQVESQQRIAEVRKVLESAKESGKRSDAINSQIERCNETLDADNIRDLNVLLLWVIHGCGTLTLRQLKSILRAHGRDPSLKFYKQIRDHFSLFFVITPKKDVPAATVSLATDSICDYLLEAAEARNMAAVLADGGDAPKADSDRVSEGEIRLVKNFLRSFCEQHLYDKLGFEDFFRNKISNADAVIRVPDEMNAQAVIVLKLLSAINGKYEDDPANELIEYASWTLDLHMARVEDLSLVELSTKSEIGVQLLELLAGSPSGVKNFAIKVQSTWFNDAWIEQVSRFLRDGAVCRRLTDDQKIWVKDCTDEENPDCDLLGKLAEKVAVIWLEEVDLDIVEGRFRMLVGYLNRIEHTKDSTVERITDAYFPLNKLTTDTIYSVAGWVQEHATSPKAETRGKFNLGVTLEIADKFEDALELYEEVKKDWENKLYVDAYIAFTYNRMKQYEKAITTVKPVIAALENGADVFDGRYADVKTGKRRWQRKLAEWYEDADDYEAASGIWETLLDDDLSDYDAVHAAIGTLHKQNKHAVIMSHLRRMEEEHDEKNDQQTKLEAMLLFHSDWSTAHSTLLSAAKAAGELDFMTSQYARALQKLQEQVSTEEENDTTLREYMSLKARYAISVHQRAESAAEKELAEKYMLEVMAFDGSKEITRYENFRVEDAQKACLEKLTSVYLERATEAGKDSNNAADMVSKVEDLAKHRVAVENDWGFHTASIHSALGKYFSKQGMLDKAREHLREEVAVGVQLLSDEDPLNDWQGYSKLGMVLMDFGDLENALAAWSMIRPTNNLKVDKDTDETTEEANDSDKETPTANGSADVPAKANRSIATKSETSKTTVEAPGVNASTTSTSAPPPPTDAVSESEDAPRPSLKRSATSNIGVFASTKLDGPLDHVCDGCFETQWTYADDIWLCRDCTFVEFDTTCLEKLKAGTLKRDICDQKHRFLHIPPFDQEKVDRLGPERVAVADKEMTVQEWLAKIREEWDIKEEKVDDDEDEDGEKEKEKDGDKGENVGEAAQLVEV